MVFLDALGLVNSQGTGSARELCSQFLLRQLEEIPGVVNGSSDHEDMTIETIQTEDNNEMFIFNGFSIPRGRSLRHFITYMKILQPGVFRYVFRVSIDCGRCLETLF